MTLAQMTTLLKSISGFENKIAYRTFPESEVPQMPYACFVDAQPAVFFADNTSYYIQPRYTVELYEKYRDPTTELLFESKFTANEMTFIRTVSYLNDEKCWAISYALTTKGE